MKRLWYMLLALSLIVSIFSGCEKSLDTAVDSNLLSVFQKSEAEVVETLGLKRDFSPPEGDDPLRNYTQFGTRLSDGSPGYEKDFYWCGHKLNTKLVFNNTFFPNTNPFFFLAEETLPCDDKAKAFAEDCLVRFMAQFGNPYKWLVQAGDAGDGGEYTAGVEKEILNNFFATPSETMSDTYLVRFQFAIPGESRPENLADSSHIQWAECCFVRSKVPSEYEADPAKVNPQNVYVRMQLYNSAYLYSFSQSE